MKCVYCKRKGILCELVKIRNSRNFERIVENYYCNNCGFVYFERLE